MLMPISHVFVARTGERIRKLPLLELIFVNWIWAVGPLVCFVLLGVIVQVGDRNARFVCE
jgi:cytochrome c-type biogenesis protein CcmH/NrfF